MHGKERIPVDSDLIKAGKKQLLEWLERPDPSVPKDLLMFEVVEKQPDMIPLRRAFEIVMAMGLRDSMVKKSRFELQLVFFVDCLNIDERQKFYAEFNRNAALTHKACQRIALCKQSLQCNRYGLVFQVVVEPGFT